MVGFEEHEKYILYQKDREEKYTKYGCSPASDRFYWEHFGSFPLF